MTSALPFDDFRTLLENFPAGDDAAANRVRTLFAKAEKPQGSLGRMEEIAAWLGALAGKRAADRQPAAGRDLRRQSRRGAARASRPRPVEATQRMVETFAAGGAAINQICLAYDLGLKVFDLALDLPTGDITDEPALDERDCAATMAFGMEAIAGGTDLLCSARWASATPPSRPRSTPRSTAAREPTGSGRAPARTRR